MSLKCPKCGAALEVRLTAAPPHQAEREGPIGSDIGSLLSEAETRTLNAWELDFISKLRERYDEWGERTKLSEKQRDILERIAEGRQR